jgi:hypothetical protein
MNPSKLLTISNITDDVCKILKSKSKNWIINMIYEALVKSKVPSLACPFKIGHSSITNWEITDEFLPTSIKRMGNWRKKRNFFANVKLFSKLPNVPKNKPFINYNLEGEIKI